MNDINFDVFLKIFDYLDSQSDLFKWSKTCKNVNNFFKEEKVCKKIVDLFYGLDVGSQKTCSYYHLLHSASTTANYFQACQHGFFKIIGKFNSLHLFSQIYCMEVATANNQYNTVKFCIDSGFNPNRYHEYHKNNNLLLIALSCHCDEILNLFYEHKFFPNDDLWLKTPDEIFEKVYDNLKELDNIRFLADPQLNSRREKLLTKVNHRKIHLNDDFNSKMPNEMIIEYLKFVPQNLVSLKRVLFDTAGRNLFPQWVDLLSTAIKLLTTDELKFVITDESKKDFLTSLFIFSKEQEMIHLLNLPDFIVDLEFLQKIYCCHTNYLDRFDNPKVHSLVVNKYVQNHGARKGNIIHYLVFGKHNYNILRFLKYWVKHYGCLQNYLASHQTHIIECDPIFDHFTDVLQMLKTTEDFNTLFKYLRMFDIVTSFEICKSAFDKFVTVATQYEICCTLFNIAAKQPDFAIKLFPNLELFSDQQFMWKVTTTNYKIRIDAWMNVKKMSLSQLSKRCFSRKIKIFGILYIFHTMKKELSNTTTNNDLINLWKKDQKSINATSLKKLNDETIDEFLKLAPFLLNPITK